MSVLVLLVAFALQPPLAEAPTDRTDVALFNHFHTGGKIVFDQVVFWDHYPEESKYHVREWRLLKRESQLPFYNHSKNRWEMLWHDGQGVRRVLASNVSQNWSDYDPEQADRAVLHKEDRRGLSPFKYKK